MEFKMFFRMERAFLNTEKHFFSREENSKLQLDSVISPLFLRIFKVRSYLLEVCTYRK